MWVAADPEFTELVGTRSARYTASIARILRHINQVS
jgi:hypothetical protein